jgi:CRISPR-associated protein Cas1
MADRVNKEMKRILPSGRAGFFYLEYCRVHMHGERVVYAIADDAKTREWNIPSANTFALMLGTGCSITQAAARKLAEERVMLAFTGTGATPLFLADLGDYAPTEYLIKWISMWPDPVKRLEKARDFVAARCENVNRYWGKLGVDASPSDLTSSFNANAKISGSIEILRGHEGEFAKGLYKVAASHYGIKWLGRQAGAENSDKLNGFLDQGNYLAYGIAGTVLWSLGIPPGLAVNHGETRAGGLVFDLADTFKDAVVLPVACQSVAAGDVSKEFREKLISAFDDLQVLPSTFNLFKEIVEK